MGFGNVEWPEESALGMQEAYSQQGQKHRCWDPHGAFSGSEKTSLAWAEGQLN